VNELRYRPFEPQDLAAVLDLFRVAYGGRSLAASQYRHFFLDGNPFGAPMIELAFDGDALVGHYALCPAESLVDGTLVRSARSMATMTHPAYAGRGIFSELAQRLYARVFDEHELAFVWGFPNPNSHYGFVNKLAWKDLFSLHFLDVPACAPNSGSAELVALEPGDVERRLGALPRTIDGVVPSARTSRFLRWRYLSDRSRYTFVGASSEQSFAVVSTYQESTTTPRTLNVVDAFYETARDALPLLEAVTAYAASTAHDVVSVWTDLRSPLWGAAERLRARPRGVITYAGVLPSMHADLDGSLSDPRRWRVSMGDSDVF
jgi:hypothetical protein